MSASRPVKVPVRILFQSRVMGVVVMNDTASSLFAELLAGGKYVIVPTFEMDGDRISRVTEMSLVPFERSVYMTKNVKRD